MRPIPDSASVSDEAWEREFLELAERMVAAGAKGGIITRFTGVGRTRIQKLYRKIHNAPAPTGAIPWGKPGSYVQPGKNQSHNWNLQCAIFLACYAKMGKVTPYPVNRGWRMMTAFDAYIALTDKLAHASPLQRLDINHAYALLVHAGFLILPAGAEIRQYPCKDCGVEYLVLTSVEQDCHACPMCAIDRNYSRLADLASSAARARNIGRNTTATPFP